MSTGEVIERNPAENLFLIVQRHLRENIPHGTTRATLCAILGKLKPCFSNPEAREFVNKIIKELNYEYTDTTGK